MNNNKVIIIPKKEELPLDLTTGQIRKKRVAAYARVSTDEEDQINSYNAQIDEYEKRIKNNPEWEFVGMFADEGITGTNTKHRDGFNKMISAALNGEIDLILVKSISRFARNTIDCLKTKRQLQERGVEIFFEKENISSLDDRAETMLTVYASFAQEESRSISTNVSWGVRKRMKDGTYKFPAKTLIGYRKNSNGMLEVIPEEAEIIQKIFNYFISGFTYREIIKLLESQNIKRPKTKKGTWDVNTIFNILSNEKYCGDLLFQKTYCKSFLSHERVKNEGNIDQYLFKDVHEPIVDRADFELAQLIKKKRLDEYNPSIDNKGASLVSGILRCASCGRLMKKITYKESRRTILTCKAVNKLKENSYIPCSLKETLDFELVTEATKEVISKYKDNIDFTLFDNTVTAYKIKEEYLSFKDKIEQQISEYQNDMNSLIKESISSGKNISDYLEQINELKSRIEELKKQENCFDDSTFEKLKISKFIEDLHGFCCKNSEITRKIANIYLREMYRLKDNSILFIISKEPTNHDLIFSKLDELIKLSNKTVKTISRGDISLTYYVADLEVLKWN